MGAYPLLIATGCYVITAIDLIYRGNLPLAVTFTAYALANAGLLAAAYGDGF